MTTVPDDYDSPWKEALSEYLQECLALLFPTVHAGIDWSRPPIFLDTELQQLVREADTGRRYADRLVQVWLPAGEDAWLLIHLEVQSQADAGFARRMFTYYSRIVDRYEREVVGMALLADTRAGWRPDTYTQQRWGCEVRYRYLVAKLSAWRQRLTELEASENPFATILLAHLSAQGTRKDVARREGVKVHLIRRLYARGWSRERVLSLLRFVDWLLALPPQGEARVRQAIAQLEEELQMPYTTSFERLAREEGRLEGKEEGREEGRAVGLAQGRGIGLQEGLQEGRQVGLQEGRLQARREDLRRIVEARFGQVPSSLAEALAGADEETLGALILRAATIATAEEL